MMVKIILWSLYLLNITHLNAAQKAPKPKPSTWERFKAGVSNTVGWDKYKQRQETKQQIIQQKTIAKPVPAIEKRSITTESGVPSEKKSWLTKKLVDYRNVKAATDFKREQMRQSNDPELQKKGQLTLVERLKSKSIKNQETPAVGGEKKTPIGGVKLPFPEKDTKTVLPPAKSIGNSGIGASKVTDQDIVEQKKKIEQNNKLAPKKTEITPKPEKTKSKDLIKFLGVDQSASKNKKPEKVKSNE